MNCIQTLSSISSDTTLANPTSNGLCWCEADPVSKMTVTVICYFFSQDRVMVYEYVVNLSIFIGKRTSASEATSSTSDQNVSSHFPDFQASSGIEFGPVGHLSRFGKVQLALRGSASRQHRLRLGKEGLVFRTGKVKTYLKLL